MRSGALAGRRGGLELAEVVPLRNLHVERELVVVRQGDSASVRGRVMASGGGRGAQGLREPVVGAGGGAGDGRQNDQLGVERAVERGALNLKEREDP